jgi:uncharacterized protein YprB with RNaseH-like and TPR domain
MIGHSKMNEMLHDMTPNGMLFDVSVSPKKEKIRNKPNVAPQQCHLMLLYRQRRRYNRHLILIRLYINFLKTYFNFYLHVRYLK